MTDERTVTIIRQWKVRRDNQFDGPYDEDKEQKITFPLKGDITIEDAKLLKACLSKVATGTFKIVINTDV